MLSLTQIARSLRTCLPACLPAALLLAGGSAWALNEDEADLLALYGDRETISLVTGNRQPVSRAPAVASVITAAEIRASGARNVDEALRGVPGMHVSVGYVYDPVYSVRGIQTKYNPQVLMLLNGVPLTSAYLGNRGDGWATIPAERIARIEVIRGPGSALYGADAFAGVINVVTLSGAEIDGTVVGSRLGSYRSREGWLQHGGKLGPLALAAHLQVGRTDGPDETVTADAASAIDGVFGTHVSHAPGALQLARDSINAGLELHWNTWRLRSDYARRYHAQLGQGVADALDTEGRYSATRSLSSLAYHSTELVNNWEIDAQASYLERTGRTRVVVFPAGTRLFPPGVHPQLPDGIAYPEGMIGMPDRQEYTRRLSASATSSGLGGHRLRLGAGAEKTGIRAIEELKNFDMQYVAGVGYLPVPLAGLTDFSQTRPFLQAASRINRFVYAQDEWIVQPDWTLTLGLRHDRYSDFGGATNPRAALVWAAAYNLTVKAMYGRAFRAPSFVEMYAINNSSAQGNPDLKPETIDTWETALVWQPSGKSQVGLNLFQYQMNDILRFAANPNPTTGATAQNTGQQRGRGFELEGRWDASHTLRLSGHYAWQRAIDRSTDQDAGLAPHQTLYLRSDWYLWGDWQLNGQFNWVGDRKREPGDARPLLSDYRTVDLYLSRGAERSTWQLGLGVRNLFDRQQKEPSVAPGNIPDDLPLPRRNWVATLQWRL